MILSISNRPSDEKNVIFPNSNITNYQNKIAVEKQVKHIIVLRSRVPCQNLIQIFNYC